MSWTVSEKSLVLLTRNKWSPKWPTPVETSTFSSFAQVWGWWPAKATSTWYLSSGSYKTHRCPLLQFCAETLLTVPKSKAWSLLPVSSAMRARTERMVDNTLPPQPSSWFLPRGWRAQQCYMGEAWLASAASPGKGFRSTVLCQPPAQSTLISGEWTERGHSLSATQS